MQAIYISTGDVVYVDDDDYELLRIHRWCLGKGGYALLTSSPTLLREKSKSRFMHRIIMQAETGTEVDHINGDKLDNRKNNLRFCTHRQNIMNKKPRSNNSSGYKGVSKFKNKWRAMIFVNGKNISLGVFEDPKEAAKAYNTAAVKHFGEYAYTNNV